MSSYPQSLDTPRLERAILRGARLERAILSEAHLGGAFLNDAHLEGAFLIRARLEGVDLRLAKGLKQGQIEMAFGDAATQLPEGLTRPARWTAATGGGAAPAEPKPPDLP